ncbi:Metal-dependent hydrolase, endonuclease/exonuclease/phosphatase family [Natronoarchaeum philippinense]|uniref:Metal-dependent hydrolase, endonuclease/exonuclease/phosphatase family n=1 Tax=Natronoarchaeum philippinense TaxID=558529 RepID=A0A285P5S9_NATPI|nr:endonuclease/exonuclease/phosphatase family protein [Natronoarchaeum philippinense]SNZ17092.1 Metal-dependent hydrolase, endonuclease/exonuclease/phosphatase family [Natronoarchaeum philippinense]
MSETLRVASYNVRVAFGDDGPDVWPNRVDAVAGALRLHAPELVGLQEPTAEQLADLSERLPEYEWVGVGRNDGEDDGEFSPIGYRPDRLELLASDTFWLSESPDDVGSVGWDAALPRIATWGQFRDRATGRQFVHANTHFDHEGERARIESASLLAERLPTLGAADDPIALTGDFNSEPDSTPYETLVSDGGAELVDAKRRSEHGHHGPDHTFTGFEDPTAGRRIDYVFVTPDIGVVQHASCVDLRADGRVPSDHLPVVADLHFE